MVRGRITALSQLREGAQQPLTQASLRFRSGGGGWESNPPLGVAEPLVLKTREVTRPHSPPCLLLPHATLIAAAYGSANRVEVLE
jgi:hypothetical protein